MSMPIDLSCHKLSKRCNLTYLYLQDAEIQIMLKVEILRKRADINRFFGALKTQGFGKMKSAMLLSTKKSMANTAETLQKSQKSVF